MLRLNKILSSKILISNSVEAEESDLVARDAVSFDENFPTFRNIVKPLSSEVTSSKKTVLT